ADFINPAGASVAASYRHQFAANGANAEPQVIAAAWALCADTDEEAQRLASSSRMAFALFFQGMLIPVPTVETALRFVAEHPETADALGRRRRAIVGGPSLVRRELEALAAAYGADELMIVTITYDHQARRRSYELIAEAFGLDKASKT